MCTETNYNPTSLSLLERARSGDETAWELISTIYAPMVYRWVSRYSLQSTDTTDILQNIFQTVYRKLDDFQHDQRCGSFRSWLKTITHSRVMDFFRTRQKQGQAAGGTDAWQQLQSQPEEPSNPQELREELAEVYHRALQILEQDFSDNVVKAFLRFEIDNVPASEVADELGMTRDAVYAAKKRVLKRLREELSGLL